MKIFVKSCLFLAVISLTIIGRQALTKEVSQSTNTVIYLHEQEPTRSAGSQQLTQTIFNNDNVIVIFYEDWCPPCKRMTPIFEHLATVYPDIVFIKVKRELYRSIFDGYNLKTVPAILFFKEGVLKKIQPSSLSQADLVGMIEMIYS